MKILVTPLTFTQEYESDFAQKLRDFADEVVYNETGEPLAGQDLIDRLKDCDGCVAGLDFFTKDVIEQCPNLKVISRYGVGYDRVDLDAAKENGVAVTNTPGANSDAVADMAICSILAVARRVPHLDSELRKGAWVASSGIEIYKKTMGIVGLGGIGKRVAKRAAGFDMQIIAYDPYMDHEYAKANNIKAVSLEELMKNSDTITMHLPLMESTKHIINAKLIGMMKKDAIIVNTARGGVIDEDALYLALKDDKIGGAGLDVYEQEPPDVSKYSQLKNVVLTPHTASNTYEAIDNMADASIDNLLKVLNGEKCNNIIV